MGNIFNPSSWHLPWTQTKPEAPKPVHRPAQPHPQCQAPVPQPAQEMLNTMASVLPAPFRQAVFHPNSQQFCVEPKSPVPGQPPLAPGAKQLYDAILAYPNCKATHAEAYAIAKNTFDAAQTFKMDPKVLLAIFAHESNGFDPDAKSHTGAGGIGQLTGSAIDETRRLSNDPHYDGPGDAQHYPRADIRAQLERPDVRATFTRIDQNTENRNNIHDNVWTSTAYARIMFDRATDGHNADISEMLERYNAAGGSQQAEYPGKVRDAYRTLWHTPLPETQHNA